MNQSRIETRSAQRVKFEQDAFPHLEALWRTALWLTTRWSKAERLVLETMARAYETWHSPNGAVGNKARLFKTLLLEFALESGENGTSEQIFSRPVSTPTTIDNGGQRYSDASTTHQELQQLSRISEVSVKGAIARLELPARLAMILRFQEGFSYRELAYITDQHEDSIRSVLNHHRRHIPHYLIRRAEAASAAADGSIECRSLAVSTEDG
jgi:RNA polymerase sigma-70 factor, ECF subfamily